MGNESISQFEARAYKILYEKYRSAFFVLVNRIQNNAEYGKDKPEERQKLLEQIGDRDKWDYIGLQSKVDIEIIKTLENCLKP